jgi:REP element-mobilizing transposase RayT
MAYNPALHNRQSIRLQGYDYSQSGAYFITICTYKKEKYFGEIVNAEVKLNLVGQYALHQWKMIPQRFENVELDEFIIMPNHIHGIIVIRSWGEGSENRHHFPPGNAFSDLSPLRINEQLQPNGTVPGSIGAIVQNYKSSTSRKINAMPKLKDIKLWQTNYYDHIIRDEEDYARIVEYIRNNPQKWEQDELFNNGL